MQLPRRIRCESVVWVPSRDSRMIKRIVEVSGGPVHIAVEHGQLVIRSKHEDGRNGRIPCEDLGVLIIDNVGTTYSHQALIAMLAAGSTTLLCGANHLPAGYIVPYPSHSEATARARLQVAASAPLKKRLWQQLVAAKIRAQAATIAPDRPERALLLTLAGKVRSGDQSNMEAQAARVYWKVWLGDRSPFRRDPDGDGINAMLNYGYALLRAAFARALAGAGLLPMFGLHHSNRGNPFCLADDLLEPCRPMVDRAVRTLVSAGKTEIDKDVKARLLTTLYDTVILDDDTMPLQIAIKRTVDSLVQCFAKKAAKLMVPVLVQP